MNQLPAVDVLVAGGGPGGIGAAVAAARAGANTLLLERYGFLGGVASHGMGMPINQMLPDGRSRSVVHDLLINRLRDYGEEALRIVEHSLFCNVEYTKVVAMDILEAAGAKYLLHSRVVDAIVENDRVVGVVLASKEGLTSIRTKVVVDATGDVDVTYFSGAATLKGRENDGFLSPMTLCFLLANVDVEGAIAYSKSDGGCIKLIEKARSKYPYLPEVISYDTGPLPLQNCLAFNTAGTKACGPLDGSKTEDMTEAERYSRRQIIQIAAALREFGGLAFQHAQLIASGAQPGVRETRRVKGLYIISEEDAKSGRRHDDVVAWRSGPIDVAYILYDEMKVHDVPYRALLPEKMDGLLVAGRCISTTHVGASSGKSMGNCMATGHAAGLAAALSSAQNCQPRELDVRKLQERLRADEVDLERSGK